MTSKVGTKGQVVIPKAMRERLGVHPGDEVEFSLTGDALRLALVRDRPALKGRFAGSGMLETLESEHRTEIAAGR